MKIRLTKLQREAIKHVRDVRHDSAMANALKAGFENGTMSVAKQDGEFLFSLTEIGSAHVEGMGVKRS